MPIDPAFIFLALVTLAGGAAAMCLRNLVHCALCAAGAFLGLAGLYLKLGAEFIGLAQILVYVGAVAILVVFVILLTRSTGPPDPTAPTSEKASALKGAPGWVIALLAGGMLVAALAPARLASPPSNQPPPQAPVRELGFKLMTTYVIPVETIGLLLTAALIGAVVIAMNDSSEATPRDPGQRLPKK